jgi:predicted TIM-barrel fold metal-dependent hydrolase
LASLPYDVYDADHHLYEPGERILFGNDFPHPEGLADPLDYIREFDGFSDAAIKRIFHSNMKGLLEGVRD